MSAEPAPLVPPRALPLGVLFGGIATVGIVAVGLLRLDRLPFTICYLKAFTGIPCPTCGSTRAVGRLFDRDLAGALAMNPLTTLAVITLLLWAAADLVLLLRGGALRFEVPETLKPFLRWGAVGAVFANWAYLVAVGR